MMNNLKALGLVVNKRTFKGEGSYIGRGSLFGNKYLIGVDGDRDEVIEKYKVYLWKRVKVDREFYNGLEGLRGKTLICYCKPLRCHGDVIINYLEWSNENKFNPFESGKRN